MCLMKNWSLFGQHPTTATGAETSPLSWPSKQPPTGRPKYSTPFLTVNESYRRGIRLPTSCSNADRFHD